MIFNSLVFCLWNFYTTKILTSKFSITECISRTIKVIASSCNRQICSVMHQLRNRKVYETHLLITVNLVWKDKFLINETIVLLYFTLTLAPCIFYYFVQWTNKCTINWQFIILLLHVSALLYHTARRTLRLSTHRADTMTASTYRVCVYIIIIIITITNCKWVVTRWQ